MEWAVFELRTERIVLDDGLLPRAGWFELSEERRRVLRTLDRPPGPLPVSLVRSERDRQDTWTLLALPWAVTVNGLPVPEGLRVLQDRDEIRIAGFERVFFSTERLAAIEPCLSSNSPLMCPRCRQELVAGTPAVCCPACGVWHHQADGLECWTYAERCALCAHSTALDTGYQWTPEEL